MTLRPASILPVWGLVLLGILVVGLYSPPERYYVWLPVVLAMAILGTFVIQLAIPRSDGLVLRMAVSVAGAVVLLALATTVFVPLAA